MKDICVLNIVIAKVWGGGEQYVYDTARAMKKLGVKVYIAVDKTNTVMQQRFAEAAEVVTFNLYSAAGIFAVNGLAGFIKKQRVDIINCHSGHAMQMCLLLKFLTGAKVVMFKHNALPAKHDFYHNWQRKNTDAFICVSRLVYDLQIQGLTEAEKQKYHLVYNGIDTEKFNKYKNIKKDPDKFVIGYAGRIAGDKGIDILLQAFEKLSEKYDNIYLQLAGTDEKGYLQKVQQFIVERNLQKCIEYLGNQKDMELYYKKLNLFVLPSVVKEAFGLVLCEAMYCGVPVITTNSGAQVEIITNGSDGTIVQARDAKVLVQSIEDAYNNYQQYLKMAANAKEKVKEKFSVIKCAEELIKIDENICAKKVKR